MRQVGCRTDQRRSITAAMSPMKKIPNKMAIMVISRGLGGWCSLSLTGMTLNLMAWQRTEGRLRPQHACVCLTSQDNLRPRSTGLKGLQRSGGPRAIRDGSWVLGDARHRLSLGACHRSCALSAYASRAPPRFEQQAGFTRSEDESLRKAKGESYGAGGSRGLRVRNLTTAERQGRARTLQPVKRSATLRRSPRLGRRCQTRI
jgi:hypothetical protein